MLVTVAALADTGVTVALTWLSCSVSSQPSSATHTVSLHCGHTHTRSQMVCTTAEQTSPDINTQKHNTDPSHEVMINTKKNIDIDLTDIQYPDIVQFLITDINLYVVVICIVMSPNDFTS